MIDSIIILILQMKEPRKKNFSILPKVTRLVSGKDKI